MNSRAAFTTYSLSRRAPSTTWVHLQMLSHQSLSKISKKITQRVGFEPTVPFEITGFQDQLLKPLGHLCILLNCGSFSIKRLNKIEYITAPFYCQALFLFFLHFLFYSRNTLRFTYVTGTVPLIYKLISASGKHAFILFTHTVCTAAAGIMKFFRACV